MELSAFQIGLLFEAAAEIGAEIASIKLGKIKPYLKKSEAFRLYGRTNIEHWIQKGLLTPRKDGDHSATWRLDRIELKVISKSVQLFQNI